jgi:hypothetical protein
MLAPHPKKPALQQDGDEYDDDELELDGDFDEAVHRNRGKRASSCGPSIGDAYYNRNIIIVQQRLSAAGLRLATTLNNIYK